MLSRIPVLLIIITIGFFPAIPAGLGRLLLERILTRCRCRRGHYLRFVFRGFSLPWRRLSLGSFFSRFELQRATHIFSSTALTVPIITFAHAHFLVHLQSDNGRNSFTFTLLRQREVVFYKKFTVVRT